MEDVKQEEKTKSNELLDVHPDKIHKKFLINQPSDKNRNVLGPPKGTFRMESSSILNRVKSFLPELINANEKLANCTDAERCELDIENTSDTDKVIEMNISLVNNELLVSDDDDDDDSSDEYSEEESNVDESEKTNSKKYSPSPLIQEITETDCEKT